MKIETRFGLQEEVHIDRDTSIIATITAVICRQYGAQYELCWFVNGTHNTVVIDDFRVTKRG